jgi:hypothetical protein
MPARASALTHRRPYGNASLHRPAFFTTKARSHEEGFLKRARVTEGERDSGVRLLEAPKAGQSRTVKIQNLGGQSKKLKLIGLVKKSTSRKIFPENIEIAK